MTDDTGASGRRSFVSSLGAAVAGIGLAAAAPSAQAQDSAGAFRPARHPEDEWLDKPAKHRTLVDAAGPIGAGEAILFANNIFASNAGAPYSLANSDIAVVICFRHNATPFAFTDAIWAKYGKALSEILKFTDPHTNQAPTTNLYNNGTYGLALPTLGNTIDGVIKQGARFAICDRATHFHARLIATAVKGDADAIYKELVANPIPSSRFVTAGVLAVNRAQEHGYTLLYAG